MGNRRPAWTGTWITALLWIASLGAHLGYDYLVDGKGPRAGLGTASLAGSSRTGRPHRR